MAPPPDASVRKGGLQQGLQQQWHRVLPLAETALPLGLLRPVAVQLL